MALDPKLLEILACPEDKGPLLYFEDESSLYNPRLKRRYAVRDDIPIMLIDEAEAVDDAEAARLDGQGRGRRHPAHVLRVGEQRDGGRFPRTSATRSRPCPSSSRPRTRSPGRCRRRRCPTPAAFDRVVTLGMGGSGIAGNMLQAVGTATLPGAGHRAQALPHARVRQRPHARVRALVLGRHRGDGRDGAGRARGGSHPGRHLERRRARSASREESGSLHVPCPDDILMPRLALGALVAPLFVVLFRMGMLPEAHAGLLRARRSSSRVGATSAGRRSKATATPHASWRARSVAPSPSSTAAAASAGSRRCGGSSR